MPVVPQRALDRLSPLVKARSGLHFGESRLSELAGRAARLFAESGQPDWDTYTMHLASPGGDVALERLIEALTVGETYFFRHRPYFEALEREVLPKLIARRRASRRLRIWSAGCATGEEAYSLAILLRRLLPDVESWQVGVLGTDLNRASLARATEGLYGDWAFRETDERFRDAHFTREGARHRIRPEPAGLVRFAHLNLVEEVYPSPTNGTADLDLILCRNVLMYLAPEKVGEILARLRGALAPDGWLMLGPTDPTPGADAGFEMHAFADAVLYRRGPNPLAAYGPNPLARFEPNPLAPFPTGKGEDISGLGVLPPLQPQLERGPGGEAPTSWPCTESMRQSAAFPLPFREGGEGVRSERRDGVSSAAAGRSVPPQNWRQACQAARTSAERGLLAEAQAHCQEAIARAKLQPEPYYLLGTLLQAQGQEESAAAAYRQALYADRTFPPALLALAAIHRRAGRAAQARQALNRAHSSLARRPVEELVLVDEGLTVGRMRDVVAQALARLDEEGS